MWNGVSFRSLNPAPCAPHPRCDSTEMVNSVVCRLAPMPQLRLIKDGLRLLYSLNLTTFQREPCSIIHVGFPVRLLRLIEDGLRLLYSLNATTSCGEPSSIIHVGFPVRLLRLIEDGLRLICIHSILLHSKGSLVLLYMWVFPCPY
jgi:hypothetical protein